jgi:prepilin-type N-terminal cleavage/methylation domain-containing protein
MAPSEITKTGASTKAGAFTKLRCFRCGAQDGFTFLELLLALILLSICAAMAYPRLSGTYGKLRHERQKQAIEKLVHHAERRARLSGGEFLLSWSGEDRSFMLHRRKEAPVAFVAASERGSLWGDEPVSAREFLAFAFDNPALPAHLGGGSRGLSGTAGRAWDPTLGPAPASEGGDGLVERLRVAEDLEVHTVGFPVLFWPSGWTSGGFVLVSRGGRGVEEFVIHPIGIGSAWTGS